MNIKQRYTSQNQITQSGFTIVELLIATTIFAIVMLIVTVAVLFVTNTYIKGNVESETQDIARSVLSTITQDIQFNKATSISVSASQFDPITKTGYFCIGDHVYVYQLDKEIIGSQAHALLLFTAGCPTNLTTPPAPTYVADLKSTSVGSDKAQELLSQNMRLSQLSLQLQRATPKPSYQLDVTVAYGEDSVFNVSPPAPPSCVQQSFGGQFCAVSTLTTTVIPRI